MASNALRAAAQQLGRCAKRAAATAPATQTPAHAELQIGLGTAADWINWASRLRGLDFTSSIKRGSPRATSYLESTRFTYAWTAANALFSRDRVMGHLHPARLPTGELNRFRLLYRDAGLTASDEAGLLAPLHATLSSIRHPEQFPWAPLASVRVIDLIYHKYTPDSYKGKGKSARTIEAVVLHGQPLTSLDLSTIIYSTRNWTVRGSLVDSSFRGAPQQYHLYITTVTKALAAVIGGYAHALQVAL
jgi:hypothetical protein